MACQLFEYHTNFSCLEGKVYSISSAHNEMFAKLTQSCRTVVWIKVQWGENFAVTVTGKSEII